ncbi:hypothetical protein [Phenylobacterium sp.]|uniref:hypothetical protein n=1 Tax=Phenylobacterium sp. TaxID=1871053 RepID=UPI0025D44430|nr:hypothetical protein [Phenylobacterium sp.]
MYRKTLFASLLASSAVVLAIASPAAAGTTERAREAIAAAEAKIHTAESLGAPNDDPRDLAEAHQALANAKNDFDSDHRDRAIQEGIRASGLADTAIGISHQRRTDALASARQNERATAEAAQDQVAATQAAARGQVDAAQQQAAQAQQQAADANARADSAQQAAAASAADAQAARSAAALAAATPPPAPQVETTVTTTNQHAVVHHPVTHTVVKRTTTTTNAAPATSSDQVTTTTKVTPQ